MDGHPFCSCRHDSIQNFCLSLRRKDSCSPPALPTFTLGLYYALKAAAVLLCAGRVSSGPDSTAYMCTCLNVSTQLRVLGERDLGVVIKSEIRDWED